MGVSIDVSSGERGKVENGRMKMGGKGCVTETRQPNGAKILDFYLVYFLVPPSSRHPNEAIWLAMEY